MRQAYDYWQNRPGCYLSPTHDRSRARCGSSDRVQETETGRSAGLTPHSHCFGFFLVNRQLCSWLSSCYTRRPTRVQATPWINLTLQGDRERATFVARSLLPCLNHPTDSHALVCRSTTLRVVDLSLRRKLGYWTRRERSLCIPGGYADQLHVSNSA